MSVSGVGPSGPMGNDPYGSSNKPNQNDPGNLSQYLSSSNNGTYIDFGQFFGSRIFSDGSITKWPSGNQAVFDKNNLDTLLNKLFDQVKKGGNTLFLSFDQMKDMQSMMSKTYSNDPNDTISAIFRYNARVGSPSGEDFLTHFTQLAKQNGIKVDISLGGRNAQPSDWNIPSSNPAQYAAQVSKMLEGYGVSGLDFDVESGNESGFTNSSMQTFISSLKSDWKGTGNTIDLTLEGDAVSKPSAGMKTYLKNFDSMFDGLNIMAYSDNQFYLSSDVLKEWVSALPKDDLSELHIGFNNTVDYTQASSNAWGQKFDIPSGSTNGEAAAAIYCQLLKGAGLSPDELGSTFLWEGKNPGQPEESTFMQEFQDYMKTHGG